MKRDAFKIMISMATLILFILFFAIDADAQRGGGRSGGGGFSGGGGRGGGGFSRQGTASGGGFSGGGAGTANQGQRRQSMGSNQQNRQSYGQSAQANRQGAYNNNWDSYHGGAYNRGAVAAGAAVVTGYTVGATYYSTPPCNPIVVDVGGTTYYQCYPDWYTQVYSDSGVIYAVVQAPEGY